MKTVLAAVAGFVLVLSVVNVDAQLVFITGDDLKQQLDTPDNSPLYGLAMGYIAGVQDTSSGTVLCIKPQQAKLEQLIHIVKKYLAEHPELLRNVRAHELVIAALSPVFPCRK